MIDVTTQVLIVGIFIAYHSTRIRLEMASSEMNDAGGGFSLLAPRHYLPKTKKITKRIAIRKK